MDIYKFLYIFLSGLPFGLLMAIVWDQFEKQLALQKTRRKAEHILQSAREQVEASMEKYRKEFNNKQENRLNLFEKEKEVINLNLKNLQIKVDKRVHQLQLKSREQESVINKFKNSIQQVNNLKKDYMNQRKQLLTELKKYLKNKIQKFENHFSINLEKLKKAMRQEIEENWLNKVKDDLEKQGKRDRDNLQKKSFFYLNMVLNRFDRAYCLERGIAPVSFKTNKNLEKIIGPHKSYLSEIEKECGVDILINKDELQASVFGIDPVRRELGRMTLKKLSKKNKVDIHSVRKAVQRSKRDLFAKIRKDGENICKKLRLRNVAAEVQNMMGALRYRYSFAQNQYFHCEEVGWLCGLLNSELSLPVKPAQRVGMFHDIGKAMDHSIEGSHAVIGADFLSKYGEKEDILHPVRAHHHDETPSTPLAYLVIAADAISGSRPGARRFTEDSYNQKMANLERIIDSFENIEDAYIMSAGREMRVIVDNKKVSDKEALNLSRQIARKIEKECSYPGLIKVTVVRHSEAVATA